MTRETNLIYLDRNRFDFYSDVQNQIYNFDLSSFVVNLEMVNQAGLAEQVKNFVDTNKIPPGNIIIILSENLLFMKAIPAESEEKEEEEIQKFQDSIPFEHIILKSYPIEGGKLLVAANKEFYSTIIKSFSKSNFKTTIVAPIYSAQINIDPTTPMDIINAKTILKNTDAIRPNGIEILEPEVIPAAAVKPGTKGTDKKRLFMLLGVFGVLMVALGFVTFNALKPEPPKKQATNPANVTPTQNSSSTLPRTQIASGSGNILPAGDIRVKILAPSGSTSSQSLQNSLTQAGFENIQTDLNKSVSTNPVIVFSPNLDETTKRQITNNVAQISANYVVQEALNPDADVLIFLIQ